MNSARIAIIFTLIAWIAPAELAVSWAVRGWAQERPTPTTDPAATDPAATNPPPTNPAATNPPATNPAATEPASVDPAAANEVPRLTVEQIDQIAKQVAETTDLDEEMQKRVTEQLRQATAAVDKANELNEQVTTFTARAQSAAERAQAIKAQIEELRGASPPVIDDSRPLAELELQLDQSEASVAKLQQTVSEAELEVANRTARRKEIRARQTAIEQALNQLQPQLKQPPPEGESAMVSAARQMELRSQDQRLRAEPAALEAELAAYDAEEAVDLMRLRRDLAKLELAGGQRALAALQEVVQDRRTSDASEQIAEAAEQAEAETHPLLRAVAERNVELAEQFKELTVQIGKIEEQLQEAKETRTAWAHTASSAKEKVKAIGLTNAIGAMLRQQKSSLPNTARYQSRIDRRTEEISDIQLRLLDLEDERSYIADAIDDPDVVADSAADMDPAIQRRYSELIVQQSENLSRLIRIQRNCFDHLIELSSTEGQIINETTDYRNFIDERILWVRSSPPLYESFGVTDEISGLVDRRRLKDTGQIIAADVRDGAIWYLCTAIVFLVLILSGSRLRASIRALGATAESFACTSMTPTVRATSYTILQTLPWPMLFAFFAWRFSKIPTDNATVQSLAAACSSVAAAYLPMEFFRRACQEKGLMESHFSWTNQSVAYIRRSIRSLMLIGLPLTLVVAALHSGGMRVGRDSVERILFIVAMIALSRFASRVLHPRKGIFSGHLQRRPDGWASRLQGFWYWAMIVVPLLLGVFTFLGYAYTAHQLAWRVFGTVVLLSLVSIVTAFLTRALLVQRRRISIETARQLRKANVKGNELPSEEIDIPTADELRSQISQSRSLLRTVMVGVALVGIWMTWIDVLPALGLLEEKPLWRSIKTVAQMETDDLGDAQFVTHDVVDNVTIADVIFAVFIGIGTVIAAKNIPGLLEIAVLKRLPIEPSVRYAIETVASYVIIMVGLIVACSALGVHWKQVQWMAAALTFGLAFGLQEMFANFVAGIIILVERPVRVGDIVTVDEVTGTVSRVQIRATTITNWDRKDYLVPNKDFITGRVLNWTLSNRFNRIVIPVGVAYGSDKEETVRQVLRVAIEHPLIVDDPAPTVTFEEFADSSLNYVLRCYISLEDMSSRLSIIHDLHTGIDDAFRKASIEIPFPQRDLHVRSVDADARLISRATGEDRTD